MSDSEDDESQGSFEFALTPAQATGRDIIDYNTKSGKKYWSGAMETLDDEGFDCTPEGLFTFLRNLEYNNTCH